MADTNKRKPRKDSRKYCLSYFENGICNKEKCKYIHKKCPLLEVEYMNKKEGYVTGHLNHIPICRFYLRGECAQGSNCQFRHEDDLPNDSEDTAFNNLYNTDRNLVSNTLPQGLDAPSTASTSGQDTLVNDDIMDVTERNSNNTTNAEILTLKNSENDCSIKLNSAQNEQNTSSSLLNGAAWVNAPEFVPKSQMNTPKSYADVCNSAQKSKPVADSGKKLCSYVAKTGHCKYPPGECNFLHGDICDLCGKALLHPTDEELRKLHYTECIKQHEKNMEHSFAVARSQDKTCGVCFEVVMEKDSNEQRFGILPNCNHCFCLTCIRKWRQARQFDNKIIRACPECRVTSDFVCPSSYWVDTKEDKDKLINDYKKALSTKDCKYFKRGSGTCPFGNKCFYRHAFPDGRICDVGPPPRQRRLRGSSDRDDVGILQHVVLWDFIEDREDDPTWQQFVEDLEELFTDSDDSDWSDFELLFDY